MTEPKSVVLPITPRGTGGKFSKFDWNAKGRFGIKNLTLFHRDLSMTGPQNEGPINGAKVGDVEFSRSRVPVFSRQRSTVGVQLPDRR